MGVPARAAVEAPEGGRAPIWRAAAPEVSAGGERLLVLRGNGWHAPFGASPPFLCRGRIYLWCVVVGRVRARRRAARTVPLARHCERQRSNPDGLRGKLDCFVAALLAMTNAYPPPRSEAERGRGTTRSVVEGACGAEADREAVAPPTALRAVPLPAARGGIRKGVTRIDTERKRGTRDNRALYLPVEDAENDTAWG